VTARAFGANELDRPHALETFEVAVAHAEVSVAV
jgi:hypothetical protein